MQKILSARNWGVYTLFISIVFLLSVGFAFARTHDDSQAGRSEDRPNPEQIREEVMVQKEERQANLQEKREERQAALNERAQERIRAYGERIVVRLNAMLERLETLADRMESRIVKLEERGFDLSVARELLNTARVEINNTQEDVDIIDSSLEEVLVSDNPKEAFSTVRDLLSSGKGGIKVAHKALVDTIREIKAGISVRPESTPENEEAEENNEETE